LEEHKRLEYIDLFEFLQSPSLHLAHKSQKHKNTSLQTIRKNQSVKSNTFLTKKQQMYFLSLLMWLSVNIFLVLSSSSSSFHLADTNPTLCFLLMNSSIMRLSSSSLSSNNSSTENGTELSGIFRFEAVPVFKPITIRRSSKHNWTNLLLSFKTLLKQFTLPVGSC